MTRIFLFLILIAFAFSTPARAGEVSARITGTEFFLEERGLGNPDRPKLIIEEFASFTCPHCAEFHKAVFPYLKKKYIDSGKAYFIYSDFPWDETALDAAIAARCMPADKYFDFISQLYAHQNDWAFHGDHEIRLGKLAETFGVPASKINECLKNEPMKEAIVRKMQNAQKTHRIETTPSLILNGEEYVDGGMSVDEVTEAIDTYMKDKGLDK